DARHRPPHAVDHGRLHGGRLRHDRPAAHRRFREQVVPGRRRPARRRALGDRGAGRLERAQRGLLPADGACGVVRPTARRRADPGSRAVRLDAGAAAADRAGFGERRSAGRARAQPAGLGRSHRRAHLLRNLAGALTMSAAAVLPCVIALPLLLALALPSRRLRAGALALAPWAALPGLAVALAGWPTAAVELPWLLVGTRLGLDPVTRVFLFLTAALWLVAGHYA